LRKKFDIRHPTENPDIIINYLLNQKETLTKWITFTDYGWRVNLV
jgi:hypothetical protein